MSCLSICRLVYCHFLFLIQNKVAKKPSNKNDTDTTFNEELKEVFSGMLGNISSLKSQLTAFSQQIKALERKVNKKIKQLEKENKKSKNKGNRNPSGFANPTKISQELCTFMKIPDGSQMARTDVTKVLPTCCFQVSIASLNAILVQDSVMTSQIIVQDI